jgi:outer membrane receptor protein involved in Fe transport
MMNILDAVYITDAQNGVNFNGATSTVFVGMGRRFNVGLKVTF